MADHPTVALVKKLRSRTAEGRLKWEEAAEEGTFQAAFPDYAVQVSKMEYRDSSDYFLRIFDSEGGLVEEVSDSDLGGLVGDSGLGFEILRDLFLAARRAAKGLDKAVKSILEALGPDDDDIPF